MDFSGLGFVCYRCRCYFSLFFTYFFRLFASGWNAATTFCDQRINLALGGDLATVIVLSVSLVVLITSSSVRISVMRLGWPVVSSTKVLNV
jgi:hypothetical protein